MIISPSVSWSPASTALKYILFWIAWNIVYFNVLMVSKDFAAYHQNSHFYFLYSSSHPGIHPVLQPSLYDCSGLPGGGSHPANVRPREHTRPALGELLLPATVPLVGDSTDSGKMQKSVFPITILHFLWQTKKLKKTFFDT